MKSLIRLTASGGLTVIDVDNYFLTFPQELPLPVYPPVRAGLAGFRLQADG